MKITKKIIAPTLVLLLLLLSEPMIAEAKGFGSETSTVVTGGGKACTVTTVYKKSYFLWICYNTEIVSQTIDCSNVAQ